MVVKGSFCSQCAAGLVLHSPKLHVVAEGASSPKVPNKIYSLATGPTWADESFLLRQKDKDSIPCSVSVKSVWNLNELPKNGI